MEDDGENESAPNLDASMEVLDEDTAAETDELNQGDTEDFEEEPSNIIRCVVKNLQFKFSPLTRATSESLIRLSLSHQRLRSHRWSPPILLTPRPLVNLFLAVARLLTEVEALDCRASQQRRVLIPSRMQPMEDE